MKGDTNPMPEPKGMQASITVLDVKLSSLESEIVTLEEERDKLRTKNGEVKSKLDAAEMERYAMKEEFKNVLLMKTEKEDVPVQLHELITLNEALKKDALEFKAACRKEMQQMKARNEELNGKINGRGQSEKNAAVTDEDIEKAKASLALLRLQVASRARESDALERKLDDVPSSHELSQYQRRFFELDNRMAAEFSHTQQFYTLFNALETQRIQMEREIGMLNSVFEGLPVGKTGQTQKEHFLHQLSGLVKEVGQALEKTTANLKEVEAEKATINSKLGELLEVHRKYTLLVRHMREELKRNGELTSKLEK